MAFDWHKQQVETRVKNARQWFRKVAEPFRGNCVIRIAKTSGKPHLYVKVKPNEEVCVTFKRGDGFLTHYPAYGGKRKHHKNAEAVVEYITGLNSCSQTS